MSRGLDFECRATGISTPRVGQINDVPNVMLYAGSQVLMVPSAADFLTAPRVAMKEGWILRSNFLTVISDAKFCTYVTLKRKAFNKVTHGEQQNCNYTAGTYHNCRG